MEPLAFEQYGMVMRIVQLLLGAALAGGGGYLTWLNRTLAPQLFPPDPRHAPWILVLALAAEIAGLVLLVEALMPRPNRKAQLAEAAERRRAAIAAADVYYAERARAADRDWRSGALPPERPGASPFDDSPFDPAPSPAAPAPPANAPAARPAAAPLAALKPTAFADTIFPSAASLAPIPLSVDGPLQPLPSPAAPPGALDASLPVSPPVGPAASLPLSPPATPPSSPAPALVANAPTEPDQAGMLGARAGPFARIRAALAAGKLEEADRLLAEERTRLTGGGVEKENELAELTGLAGDHAAASGRIGGAKWLWRLALQRFGSANAINSPAARVVSERLRLADG